MCVINKLPNVFQKCVVETDIDWDCVYKTSIDTRLRVFQFKIIKNILPVNNLLNRCKVLVLNKFSYCFLYEETIQHLSVSVM